MERSCTITCSSGVCYPLFAMLLFQVVGTSSMLCVHCWNKVDLVFPLCFLDGNKEKVFFFHFLGWIVKKRILEQLIGFFSVLLLSILEKTRKVVFDLVLESACIVNTCAHLHSSCTRCGFTFICSDAHILSLFLSFKERWSNNSKSCLTLLKKNSGIE